MTLQNAPPSLDYDRDKKFSRVLRLLYMQAMFFLYEQTSNFSYKLYFLLGFQTYDCYMLGKRSFKKAFCTKAIKATFLQAS